MVLPYLTLGGVVGIVLSAGFLWWEVGRYAAPQVPVTVFEDRKVLAAYTVGLFVGVPLAAAYILLVRAFANGALPGALLLLVGLVVGTEVAQSWLARSAYWGSTAAVPFYVVSFRAGAGGILALAAVAYAFGAGTSPAPWAVAASLLSAVALVALEVAGAFLSFSARGRPSRPVGGPLAGGLFGGVAFFLLGIGPTAGPVGAMAAPLVVLAGSLLTYRGRRGVLDEVRPPTAAPTDTEDRPLAYGRTGPLPSTHPDEEERR